MQNTRVLIMTYSVSHPVAGSVVNPPGTNKFRIFYSKHFLLRSNFLFDNDGHETSLLVS